MKFKHKTPSYHFFLAHASSDKPTAEALYELLAPHCRVFLDSRCVRPGESWDQKLPEAQFNSLVSVVVVSSNTDGAYYQREEIAAAIAMARAEKENHLIVPLFLDERCRTQISIPYGLRQKQGITLSNNCDLDSAAKKLLVMLDDLKPALKSRPPSDRDVLRERLKSVVADKYKVLERIANGSTTKVYGAEDTILKRRVAIKVVTHARFKMDFLKTLEKSAELLKFVPHCVPIFGAWNSDPCHVVMRHFDGGTLRERIEENNGFETKRAHEILINIGDALVVAHDKEITHCNIKPSNILMNSRDDSHLFPYLSLMCRVERVNKAAILQDLGRRALKKNDKSVLEDLAYIPPEIFGSFESCPDSHKKVDQYMLGLLGYELLTGSVPNTFTDVKALQEEGITAYHPLNSLAKSKEPCPSRLSHIILKMTRQGPQYRYASLKDAVDALKKAAIDVFAIASDSYLRCLTNDRDQKFMETFYQEFCRISAEAKSKFKSFDTNKFEKQHGMLKDAIFILLMFGERKWDQTKPTALSRIKDLHGAGGMRISPDCYRKFIEAFTNTVCGFGNVKMAFDPNCGNSEEERCEIREAWTKALKPGIDYMQDLPRM